MYSIFSFDSRVLVGKASIRPCQSPGAGACLTLPSKFENEGGVSIDLNRIRQTKRHHDCMPNLGGAVLTYVDIGSRSFLPTSMLSRVLVVRRFCIRASKQVRTHWSTIFLLAVDKLVMLHVMHVENKDDEWMIV